MANNPHLSNASANASVTAVIALLVNSGQTGQLGIYSGTQPANSQTALSGNTLQATPTFASTAFGAPSAGVSTANTITSATAGNTGTASFFRVFDKAADIGSTGIFDGSISTSGADLNLNTTSIVSGASVGVSSFTYTQPQ